MCTSYFMCLLKEKIVLLTTEFIHQLPVVYVQIYHKRISGVQRPVPTCLTSLKLDLRDQCQDIHCHDLPGIDLNQQGPDLTDICNTISIPPHAVCSQINIEVT